MNPCFWGGRIWKKWGFAGWYLHWGEGKSAPIRSILKSMKQNETGFSEHESPQKQPSQWKLPLFLCMWWRNKEESFVFSDGISKLEVAEQYWFHCLFYYFSKLERRIAKWPFVQGAFWARSNSPPCTLWVREARGIENYPNVSSDDPLQPPFFVKHTAGQFIVCIFGSYPNFPNIRDCCFEDTLIPSPR